MKIIRASEVGTYRFCKRAWWYQLQGYEPENKTELAGGSEIHEKHARGVQAASCIEAVAYTFLLLAIVSVVIWVIGEYL